VYHHSIYHTLRRAGLPSHFSLLPPSLPRTHPIASAELSSIMHFAHSAAADDARFFCFARWFYVFSYMYTPATVVLFSTHAVAMDKECGSEVAHWHTTFFACLNLQPHLYT
jgi:hypothetical protein